MGMSNSCNPYGGHNTLVDKCLGPDAYQVVQYVARHMQDIIRASANTNLQIQLTTPLLFIAGGAAIAMPPNCTVDQVRSSSVMLKTTNGHLLGSDSGLFTTTIDGTGMTMMLTAAGNDDASLTGSEVRWFLIYEAATND